MKAVITGAGGFVGRELTKHLRSQGYTSLTLVDNHWSDDWLANDSRILKIEGELQDPNTRRKALSSDFDTLFHLAAVPGGAAEADPALSKLVNLEATLNLFEEASQRAKCPRIVFTSTIAVLEASISHIDDNSPINPSMTYGTHKAMIELALADLSRRKMVDSVSVRLPGIVARPPAPSGLKSAFLSNIFHALQADTPFISPVSEAATMWLMSVQRCVKNLAHAAQLKTELMPTSRAVTLPALRVSMPELAHAITKATNTDASLLSYKPEADLEKVFGRQPPLTTTAAEKAGFTHDDDITSLVNNALALYQ